MTNNIKRLASGFSALALILGNVVVPAGSVFADTDFESCLAGTENVCALFEDVTMDGLYTLDRDLTIELNGHSITSSTTAKFFQVGGRTLNITGPGSISTTNTLNTGIIRVYGTASADSSDRTQVTIGEGVTLEGPNPIVVYNNGTTAYNMQIDIYGTLAGQNSGIWMLGNIKDKTNYPLVNIHDGATITASNEDGVAVSAMGYARWDIGEATITGSGSGIGIKSGIVNVDGADVTGTAAPEVLPPATYNNGINASGAAIQIEKNSGYAGGIELSVESGSFTSEHESAIYSYGTVDSIESLAITGGVFSTDPAEYLAGGYNSYDGGNGYYVIADDDFTIAFPQSEYSVAEGHDITLNATVTPTKIGASDRTDVVYSAYYTNGDELTNEEISVEGNAVSAKVGAIGTYKIVAEDMNGNTAEALLKVVAHGSLEVEDKTIYVDLSDWGDDSNVRTFAELGVTASGEGITYELSGEDNIYINDEDQTATIYGENVITWFYDGEERGKTTVKAYSVYDDSEYYGIRVNGFFYYYPEHIASEGVTARIADETIAKFSTMTEQSGDEEYTQTVIEGLKAGETALEYVYDGRVVKTTPIRVYEITTTMKRAQAVGTSQTFTVTTGGGYKVVGFSVAAADSYSSEEENAEKSVEGSINKDGTFTITVNKMPVYMAYGYDDEGNEVTSEEKSPYAYAVFILEDKNGNRYEEGYGIVLFEFEATDEAAEAVDDEEGVARSNEKVMQAYVTSIIEEVMAGDINEDGTMELTLDDGTKVTISDTERLAEAILGGETIEAVLTEPETRKESELGDAEVAKLKSEMGSGKTGHRFVEIDVELRAGGETVGKITELDKSLKVSVDVSDDAAVADGYTRVYSVVRYHGGKAEKLSDVEFDAEHKIVSFDSDRFSTYLIAYTDMPEIPRAPDTGIVKD